MRWPEICHIDQLIIFGEKGRVLQQ
jgi:hypothetical protein